MFCENCGKQLQEGSQFCDGCGTKTAGPQQSQEQAAPNYQPNTPPAYQQNQYDNSAYQNFPPQQNGKVAPVMSVGAYIGTLIVFAIPVVNIIMIFVWAFGSSTNPNRKNYARALLILSIIGIVLSIVFSIFIGPFFTRFLSDIFGDLYSY